MEENKKKQEETAQQETESTKKENFLKRSFRKTKEFVKANAKKIAGGIVGTVAVVAAVAYAISMARRGDPGEEMFDPDEGPEPGDDFPIQEEEHIATEETE